MRNKEGVIFFIIGRTPRHDAPNAVITFHFIGSQTLSWWSLPYKPLQPVTKDTVAHVADVTVSGDKG